MRSRIEPVSFRSSVARALHFSRFSSLNVGSKVGNGQKEEEDLLRRLLPAYADSGIAKSGFDVVERVLPEMHHAGDQRGVGFPLGQYRA